jgi:hypothetical protein
LEVVTATLLLGSTAAICDFTFSVIWLSGIAAVCSDASDAAAGAASADDGAGAGADDSEDGEDSEGADGGEDGALRAEATRVLEESSLPLFAPLFVERCLVEPVSLFATLPCACSCD